MYSKILVPIDGSEPSTLALVEAIKLAHALDSSICVIHVVDVRPLIASEATAASYDILFDMLRRDGAELLRNAAATIKDAGIKVETILQEAPDGQVGEAVFRQAREYQAELIICGTHGRRGVRRMLMGSDAEYIVRQSPVPVLLVRQPDAA
ncbi:MAG: universal stress protein [Steroidobacteraceae bacterium]